MTLTEVLMSVVLTGFGVVTLATLFPIAAMRTVQATHLTHSTVLRYNAEALIDLFPMLLTDPDGAGTLAGLRAAAPDATIPFALDPLGARIIGDNQFGNGGTASIPRFDGGLGNDPVAVRNFVTLGGDPGTTTGRSDNFEFHVEATPVSATATSVTMSTEISLIDVPDASTPAPAQVVLFSTTGRGSQTRSIDAIAGQEVRWIAPLPAGFNIEKARILTPESRYTWLLTVRNLPGGAGSNVTVVVFFKRSFALEDERVVDASFVYGSNQVNVSWTGDRPFFVKGGHVFDVQNGYWYLIQQVANETAGSATLSLEKPASADSNAAMFPRGIVETYPIGTK